MEAPLTPAKRLLHVIMNGKIHCFAVVDLNNGLKIGG